MKQIETKEKRVRVRYKCESCGKIFSTAERALRCERKDAKRKS